MRRIEMYKNGEYFASNPTWDAGDAAWKVRYIKELLVKNQVSFNKVVDVGCGAGKMLQELYDLYPFVKQWEGYDVSPQAIELTGQVQNRQISFYNDDFINNTSQRADLLLLIDVIEHVTDYYGFLDSLQKRSDFFIFHIPLDLSCRTLVKSHVLLQQRNAVGHIHYFSKEMVLWMLNDTGYEVVDWIYTKPAIDLFRQHTVKNKIKKGLRKFSFSLDKDNSVKWWGGYSMMILAK